MNEDGRDISSDMRMAVNSTTTLDNDREAWERQRTEPITNYLWFQLYLEQNAGVKERSLQAAHDKLIVACQDQEVAPPSDAEFFRIANEWYWKNRAEAYDEYVVKTRRSAYIKQVEEMGARQAHRAIQAASLGIQILEEIMKRFAQEKDGLSLNDLLKRMKPALEAVAIGQHEERLTRGIHREILTSNIQEDNQFDKMLTALEEDTSPEMVEAITKMELILTKQTKQVRMRGK